MNARFATKGRLMCGIFGALHLTDRFAERDFARFVELTDLVKYRGPDASGYVALSKTDGRVAASHGFDLFFGHRRLSILDLSEAGNQPMNDGKHLWITFNGEVFNYLELKAELQEQGFTFRSGTDTEVILALYNRWGVDGFSRMNGEWAFALADLGKRELLLCRDRFSIKPLYYCKVGSRFFFASEIKQLLPLLDKVEVNPHTLSLYLAQGLLDFSEQTLFKAIYRVKPRHVLRIPLGPGPWRQSAYWSYAPKPTHLSFPDAKEQFRELLTDSIRIRLRSDVPVGALLSGGLDSSAITVIATRLNPSRFQSYSVIPDDPRFSEEKFIDPLIRHCGIANTKVPFDLARTLESIPRVLFHNDEPPAGLSAVAHFQMMQEIRHTADLKVVLSGQGGDELLLGYRKFFFFALRQLVRDRALLRAAGEVAWSMARGTTLWQFDLGDARRYLPRVLRGSKPYLRDSAPPLDVSAGSQLTARQIADLESLSVPNLTHYEDRNSMAFGLEIRLPFLDPRLVEFALGIPTHFLVNRGWSKYLLREALTELPSEVRLRKDKRGFHIPESEWLKNQLVPIIDRAFKRSLLAELGLIDPRRFLEYYAAFRMGTVRAWYQDISRVFLAELWAQQHFDSATASASSASLPMGRSHGVLHG